MFVRLTGYSLGQMGCIYISIKMDNGAKILQKVPNSCQYMRVGYHGYVFLFSLLVEIGFTLKCAIENDMMRDYMQCGTSAEYLKYLYSTQ